MSMEEIIMQNEYSPVSLGGRLRWPGIIDGNIILDGHPHCYGTRARVIGMVNEAMSWAWKRFQAQDIALGC